MSELWVPHSVKQKLDEQRALVPLNPNVVIEGELLKSIQSAKARRQPYRFSETLYAIGAYNGIKEPTMATYQTMQIYRNVQRRNPLVALAIHIMQNKTGKFARRPKFRGDTGGAVKMRDSQKAPSAAAEKKIKEIEDIVFRGGYLRPRYGTHGKIGVWSADGSEKALGLAAGLRALVNDSLTLDASAFRKEEGANSSRYPVVFWNPVDAARVRFAVPENIGGDDISHTLSDHYMPEIRQDINVSYIMRDAGGVGIEREFTDTEMAYMIRNYRTDVAVMGYGQSEIDQMIEIIAGVIYGIKYNTEFFDTNHVPAGILALRGQYQDEVLDDFRYQLENMVGGNGGYHRMPIIADPDGNGGQYIPLKEPDTSGMYFEKWINFCGVIIGKLYGLDPSEMGLTTFGASSNSLGTGGNPLEKIEAANTSGLEPLLSSFEAFIDEEIVAAIDMDFQWTWTGLNEAGKEAEEKSSIYRMEQGLSTPNNERARVDEPPIRDPLNYKLWRLCLEKVQEDDPDELDAVLQENAAKIYEANGGEWAIWPNAPVGNAAAMAVWQIEHNLQPPQKSGPGGGEEQDEDNSEKEDDDQQQDQSSSADKSNDQDMPEQPPQPVKVNMSSFHDRPGAQTNRDE